MSRFLFQNERTLPYSIHLVMHKMKLFKLESLSLTADITLVLTIKFAGISYIEQVMDYTSKKLKFYMNDYEMHKVDDLDQDKIFLSSVTKLKSTNWTEG